MYYKETNTGQYVHFSSFTPWRYKIAWINSLYHRAKKICSDPEQLNKQILKIRKFAAWNGFPKYVTNVIINRLNRNNNNRDAPPNQDENIPTLWLTLPYTGDKGVNLAKFCLRKIRRYLKPVKIVVRYKDRKLSFYCSNKDKIPVE